MFCLFLVLIKYFKFIHSQNLLPDFISVTIPNKDDPENPKSIIVEIINDPIIKPFLGGFVNKMTGNGLLTLVKIDGVLLGDQTFKFSF